MVTVSAPAVTLSPVKPPLLTMLRIALLVVAAAPLMLSLASTATVPPLDGSDTESLTKANTVASVILAVAVAQVVAITVEQMR